MTERVVRPGKQDAGWAQVYNGEVPVGPGKRQNSVHSAIASGRFRKDLATVPSER